MLNNSSPETLLDDEELVSTLESSKITSKSIAEKLVESEALEKVIEETRSQYRKVSVRGSLLFFVIKDLAGIDPMYQYSLQYVKKLFNAAIQKASPSEQLATRLEHLLSSIQRTIFSNVSRGLFEAHKLIFSFLIAVAIEREQKTISEPLWNAFLRGAGVLEQRLPANPVNELISDANWELAHFLSESF